MKGERGERDRHTEGIVTGMLPRYNSRSLFKSAICTMDFSLILLHPPTRTEKENINNMILTK